MDYFLFPDLAVSLMKRDLWAEKVMKDYDIKNPFKDISDKEFELMTLDEFDHKLSGIFVDRS